MLIVLEGPECTGKSTVARKLCERHSIKLVKNVRIPNRFQLLASVIGDIENELVRTRDVLGKRPIVFDRWMLISDIIYEKYCYNTDSILEPLLPALGPVMAQAGVVIVYITISQPEMLRRFESRGDLLRTKEEAIITHNAYDTFFQKWGKKLPCVTIQADGLTEEQLYDEVCRQVGIEARRD